MTKKILEIQPSFKLPDFFNLPVTIPKTPPKPTRVQYNHPEAALEALKTRNKFSAEISRIRKKSMFDKQKKLNPFLKQYYEEISKTVTQEHDSNTPLISNRSVGY